MDVFELRGKLVRDYADYTTSFVQIDDTRIRKWMEVLDLVGGGAGSA